jgi:hypothetical protein
MKKIYTFGRERTFKGAIMKNKFSLSIITTALLLTSTASFATVLKDSVAQIEAKALQNPTSVESKAAEEKVDKTISKEAYLAKVKAGAFKKEVTQEETKRLRKIVNNAVQAHKNSLKKAPKEFMTALNDTVLALHAIKSNKTAQAQKLLAQADKEFTTAFKKNPKLGMLPIMDNAEIITFNGSPALIKHIKESAVKLLQDNDTQIAIDMLLPLQDEIIIKTEYVPAYLYPKAVKKAQKELKAGKKDAAFATVVTALDAAQLDTAIIPIPLITAQDMVLQASKLEKSHKKEALELLGMAQTELQKAVLLGYAHEDQAAYKTLQTKITAIQKEIKGKNIVSKLYNDLLHDFKKLGDKHKKDDKLSKK